jgi:acyl-coenzyme A thioesterase PaaI-like protein
MKAIQDHYPERFAHCFGCGPANPSGLHLKSFLGDDHTWARFTIENKFSGGVPGNAYGGIIASLLDCHGTASAAAFAYRDRGRSIGDNGPAIRFVTVSLSINFAKPTPLGEELLIKGILKSIEGRKANINLFLNSRDSECATGEMVAIEIKS